MKCLVQSEVKKRRLLAVRGCHRRQGQGAADSPYQEAQGAVRSRLESGSCSVQRLAKWQHERKRIS